MKAFQKFIHLCLIVAILMATTGFRVNAVRCAGGEGEVSIRLSPELSCCCGKKEKQASRQGCNDMSCVMQLGSSAPLTFTSSSEQVEKKVAQAAKVQVRAFQVIRPVLLTAIPAVILPPPISGRDIGILYQTFLI